MIYFREIDELCKNEPAWERIAEILEDGTYLMKFDKKLIDHGTAKRKWQKIDNITFTFARGCIDRSLESLSLEKLTIEGPKSHIQCAQDDLRNWFSKKNPNLWITGT